MQEEQVISEPAVCCPELDVNQWNNVEHKWNDKLFVKHSIPQLFHIPLPGVYAKTITHYWEKAQEAGVAPELKDFLLLAHDPSPFKSELYLAVTKELPGENNVRLSGTFISKVFDGPYNGVPKYIREMNEYLSSIGKQPKKYYFYYAYCPKCAKKYGHNYIVAFAQV